VTQRLAGHIHQRFIVKKHEGSGGHAGPELALVRLYRIDHDARWLGLAYEWIERRGKPRNHPSETPRSYFMDHRPIRDVPEATGHAVGTLFYLTGVADVAQERNDGSLKAAARRLWRDVVRRKMYVTGSVGTQNSDEGSGPACGLPLGGYCEFCAACGLIYFADSMFRMGGYSEAMDVLERTFYNAILHGISLDEIFTEASQHE
jgi:uncharacterized protein